MASARPCDHCVPMLSRGRLTLSLHDLALPLETLAPPSPPAPVNAEAQAQGSLVAVHVAPAAAPPGVEQLRRVALAELLALAHQGQATVQLPLLPRTWGMGPLSVETVAGQQLVVRLVVRDGQVAFEACRGLVEPPLSLPLGIGFNGVRLNADGAVVADFTRFPDLNLSDVALRGQRVPRTLQGLLDLVFAPRPPAAAAEPARAPRTPPPVDMRGLSVEATGVVPHGRPLLLGEHTAVALGPQTRLDIRYAAHQLDIRGAVTVAQGRVGGRGFALEGLSGSGAASFGMSFRDGDDALSLEVTGMDARLDRAVLEPSAGSRLELVGVVVTGATLRLQRAAGALSVTLRVPHLEATLPEGHLTVHLNGRPSVVRLGPVHVHGSLTVEDGQVSADLTVVDGKAVATDVTLDLGVARVAISELAADLKGRLVLSAGGAFRMEGALALDARVSDGQLGLGAVHAALGQGTALHLDVGWVEAARGQWSLGGSGALRVELGGGAVRLWEGTTLAFSRGGTGTLGLRTVRLSSEERWPRLEGGLEVSATADATALGAGMTLPPGTARARVEDMRLGGDGVLHLGRVWVDVGTDVPATPGPQEATDPPGQPPDAPSE